MLKAEPSAMDDWVKRLAVSLTMAFVLGGLAVMASDQGQERRIGEVEFQADGHDVDILSLRESRIAVEHDIAQIQRDIERIAVGMERLSN